MAVTLQRVKMRRSRPRVTSGAVALVVVAASIASCGGDSSPQDYFSDLATETRSYDEALLELRTAYGDDLSAELADLQERTDFSDTAAVDAYFDQAKEVAIVKTADLLADTGAALRRLLDALEALEPPEGVASAHQDALATGEALASAMPVTIEAVRSLGSIEDLQSTIDGSPVTVAAQRFGIACQNLEDAATGAGIEVDLSCPDGIKGSAE